jgi:tRNA dimethylallyltransferase
VAKSLKTSIISADSRQFYKELSIGTARPTNEEMEDVPHYFVGSHSLEEELTAAGFEQQALEIVSEEFKSKDTLVLTGGSGMFVDALCIGLDPIPTSKEEKEQLQERFNQNGLAPLLDELKEKDLVYFDQVDQKNPMRILRALEVIQITGKPYSELRKSQPVARPFRVHRFVIDHERQFLYDRINHRVDLMLEAGLIEEVKSVIKFRHLTSMNTVGYKEIFAYLDGHSTLEEATTLIKQNSRRYAKRQTTWLKRHPDSKWIKWSNLETMKKEILEELSNLLNLE